MKTRISCSLALLCLILLLGSCASLPKKMQNYADKTERNCQDYTVEDWKASAAHFSPMVKEYVQKRQQYDTRQRLQATTAMTKYYTLLGKGLVGKGADYISGIMEEVPSFLQGILGNVKSKGAGFLDFLSGIFGSQGSDWLEKIGDAIGDAMDRLGAGEGGYEDPDW